MKPAEGRKMSLTSPPQVGPKKESPKKEGGKMSRPSHSWKTRVLSRIPVVVTVCDSTFTVLLDPHAQHTLSWRESIGTLPPGITCNLFKYPLVVTASEMPTSPDKGVQAMQRAKRRFAASQGDARPGLARAVAMVLVTRRKARRPPPLMRTTKDGSWKDDPSDAHNSASTPQSPEAKHGRIGFVSEPPRSPSARESRSSFASLQGGWDGVLQRAADLRPAALVRAQKKSVNLTKDFFGGLGLNEAFFDMAEDANGAWHDEDLRRYVLNDEQLTLLDELVLAVAMLGAPDKADNDDNDDDDGGSGCRGSGCRGGGQEPHTDEVKVLQVDVGAEGGAVCADSGLANADGGAVKAESTVVKAEATSERSRSSRSRSRMDPFMVPDASGAYPLHALLVANTKASIELALRIMELRPDLITQAHGPGRFVGENALHILAVNRRYEAFERLVGLACRLLDDSSLRALLFTQAEGKFFADP
jgi:hypothetical protein